MSTIFNFLSENTDQQTDQQTDTRGVKKYKDQQTDTRDVAKKEKHLFFLNCVYIYLCKLNINGPQLLFYTLYHNP